jgi:gliding motility-associated-like protein
MKKSLILILLFLIHQQLYAQTEYLAKLDLTTGGITKIKKIDSVKWIWSGPDAAFNQIRRHYTFIATDTVLASHIKLYTLDATGNVVAKPSFVHSGVMGLVYDASNNNLYACRYDSIQQKEFFISIDIYTGQATDIIEINSLKGIAFGGVAFDEVHKRYYILGATNTGDIGLFIVDLKNLTSIFHPYSKPDINGGLNSGLQYDKKLDKLFCLYSVNKISFLVNIDTNGVVTKIDSIPGMQGSTIVHHGYDQLHHYFFFHGVDKNQDWRLYTLNALNAQVVTKPLYAKGANNGSLNNAVFPRHDSNTDITYILFWEALTLPDTTNPPDTALTIDNIPEPVKQDCIIAPNAFSPNGDGRNDVFCAKAICNTRKFYMQVFNRRGRKVFESENIREGWDGNFKGSPAGMDTYFYMIQYQTDIAGPQTLQGNISLIR